MRDLRENTGAVAHQRVGADRAAMFEILQDAETVANDLVRLLALEAGDEADAAGIAVVLRIVETLRQVHAGQGRAHAFAGPAQIATAGLKRLHPSLDAAHG